MSEQSPDYKALFLEERRQREDAEQRRSEEQRRREDAEQRRSEEQRRREDAEQRRSEEQRRREDAEADLRNTSLLEFLDGCHVHLHLHLSIQSRSLSTQGDPSNARAKVCPKKIRVWRNFAEEQEKIWASLMESSLPRQRLFNSLSMLQGNGRDISHRKLASELDLQHFQRLTVENPVASIIRCMYEDKQLRREFRLKGSVSFENHANTLDTETIEGQTRQLSIREKSTRRSTRIQARSEQVGQSSSGPTEGAATATSRLPRPRADQFCVYNVADGSWEQRLPAIVFELKAAHKFPLGYIYAGLGEIDLAEVMHVPLQDSPQQQFRRLVAAIITQAFSYMVQSGLEYGCVCTGEAYIFLRVPNNPDIVEYYLAVPKGDVGETSGWTQMDEDAPNRLHLTAVGQMLAFTLRALKTTPRDQDWIRASLARLERWEVRSEELLEGIAPKDAPSSEYRPAPENRYHRMSPVRLRWRSGASGCNPWVESTGQDDEAFDPDTPSGPPQRSSRRGGPARPGRQQAKNAGGATDDSSHQRRQSQAAWEYCTQECLLGLRDGGALDMKCPNVRRHGENRHAITSQRVVHGIRLQMRNKPDDGCKQVGRPGSRGVMFQVKLLSHGYTVVAKGTLDHFVPLLQHEASMYEILRPIQGRHVPVYLGSIHLEPPWYFEGIAEIVHMMFLGYGGQPISKVGGDPDILRRETETSVRAVHRHGVLQCDAEARNLLWSDGRVMVIDFERAKVLEARTALGVLAPNRKRKQHDDVGKSSEQSACSHELRQALGAVPITAGTQQR